MTYRAPIADYSFISQDILSYGDIENTDRFAEAGTDVANAVFEEAGKLAAEVMAPIQRNGDLNGAVLENGVVRCSPGYAEAYAQIAEGGWIGMASDPEFGGMGLPMVITTAVNEMLSGSCLSLSLNPLMSQGQIEAIEHHASDEIKALYLPKLISGEWSGTMNLTEAGAGSDVGALATKAVANDDGSYAITGQKIFISWGDNDFTQNICHLVLARLPDSPAGTKGISLFIVPKLIPDENGNPGVANSLKVVSLEHKLGLHGSPTCVMQYEGAKGWLIGQPNEGMKCMFTMMNNARLGVGVQGLGVAEAAYQKALAYAQDRKQGRTPVGEGIGAIIDHADVRRMLITMKAEIFAARAIAFACAHSIDLKNATADKAHEARAAFLTPIAKAFGTDVGISVAEMGVQVHGGMGFIEETGAAQFARDVRVTAIYEGTNGIQSMDLVGRKLMDGGDAAFALLDEMEAQIELARERFPDLAAAIWESVETLRETIDWMVGQSDLNERFAGAVPFLKATARVLGGYYHLRAAMIEGGTGPRSKLARFYIQRLLPEYNCLLIHARQGAAGLYDLSIDDLTA